MSKVKRLLLVAAPVVVGVYGLSLVAVSLASETRVVPKGEPLRFCGAYLDCHLSATVTGFEVAPGVGGGLRYRVIVRFASDAKRATLPIRNVRGVLLGPGGVRLQPVAAPRYLEVGPGAGLEVDFVFDSLDPITSPLLWLTEGSSTARLAERLLIGDSESWLHKPVVMEVTQY